MFPLASNTLANLIPVMTIIFRKSFRHFNGPRDKYAAEKWDQRRVVAN